MNRLLLLLAALALVLVAGGAQAALPTASPDGKPSIQAEPPADGVPITGCTVITFPGTYYLARSLSGLDCPVAISIRSSDVVIDGRNYSIGGQNLSGTIGIEIRPPDGGTAVTNVRVTNVRLSDWGTGLVAAPAPSGSAPTTDVRLTGVSAASSGTGFRLWGPGTMTLEGCTAESNEWYGNPCRRSHGRPHARPD